MAALVAALPEVSREACSVALAHRLAASGYVAILTSEGRLQFAARSGDALPLRRDSDQTRTELWTGLGNSGRYRAEGRLAFPRGSLTDRLYVDALGAGDVSYVVAVTDSPDWPVLHHIDRSKIPDGHLEGWCGQCTVTFTSTQLCPACGSARHDACGGCDCPPAPVRGARPCQRCFLELPPHMFTGPDPNVCDEHS